jgi:phosphoribosylformimino-5-aminoimidazole carboxamide ribotide isomerase
MVILPAIDIKDGECVRLYRGVMDTAEKVAADALETAAHFKAAGAAWIHMVDLNGPLPANASTATFFLPSRAKAACLWNSAEAFARWRTSTTI